MANIGYIRVSTTDQNTSRQLSDLTIELDKIFEEKVSGATREREQLKAMMDYVRDGDTVYVHSIDRLGRSLIDLKNIIEELKIKGVTVLFVKNGLEFNASQNNSTPLSVVIALYSTNNFCSAILILLSLVLSILFQYFFY